MLRDLSFTVPSKGMKNKYSSTLLFLTTHLPDTGINCVASGGRWYLYSSPSNFSSSSVLIFFTDSSKVEKGLTSLGATLHAAVYTPQHFADELDEFTNQTRTDFATFSLPPSEERIYKNIQNHVQQVMQRENMKEYVHDRIYQYLNYIPRHQ